MGRVGWGDGKREGIVMGVGLALSTFHKVPFTWAERVILSSVCPTGPILTWRTSHEVDFSLSYHVCL